MMTQIWNKKCQEKFFSQSVLLGNWTAVAVPTMYCISWCVFINNIIQVTITYSIGQAALQEYKTLLIEWKKYV